MIAQVAGVWELKAAEPTTGLRLVVRPDGTFSETKTAPVALTWFDQEGVLDSGVTPFDGRLVVDQGRLLLLLAAPISWATPRDSVRQARVRYDDGDTIVCDALDLRDGTLMRTLSVVTDELYLDRTVLLYQRVAD